jgi:peptide/nickel transport system ATP-binding protein
VSGDGLLVVEHLRVETTAGAVIVEDVAFSLVEGEILGVVGESGSGKTTVSLALLGYARPGARIVGGSVSVAGRNIATLGEREIRELRGRLVSYVPQDPGSALNPSLRVGDQIGEMLRARNARATKTEIRRALERAHLPGDAGFQRRYPHQLSGGQQQRVAIAIALVNEPPLVILDEPTTGLDVVTQSHILAELERLRSEIGTAMVYVSHNLAVVGSLADRVAVMYGGWIVEEGPTEEILRSPKHPYTHGLVSSIPDHAVPRHLHGIPGVAVGVGDRPPGCPFAPRCPQRTERAEHEMPGRETVAPGHHIRCFEWRRTPALEVEPPLEPVAERREAVPLIAVRELVAGYRSRKEEVAAAQDISFSVRPGESLALVGESGSGKTTIARCVAGLHAPWSGEVALDGIPLAALAKRRSKQQRQRIQIVFQNPYDSLNPRHRIADAIARPARLFRGLAPAAAAAEAIELLERVRLPARLARRYPRDLSGGERQRVAIARALAARPGLLICDEVTSALDVSVQAAVLELLAELRVEFGLSLLFISHDLGVVASVCDRVLVLQSGIVREQGRADVLLSRPGDEYTRLLVESAPRLPSASVTP